MTTKFDITVPQSDTFRLVITVNGGPVALAGYACVMQVRQSKASTAFLAEMGEELFTVDDINRQVVLEVPDEQTALYDWASPAVYDIHMEGPAGDRWRLLEGTARLNKTVTR